MLRSEDLARAQRPPTELAKLAARVEQLEDEAREAEPFVPERLQERLRAAREMLDKAESDRAGLEREALEKLISLGRGLEEEQAENLKLLIAYADSREALAAQREAYEAALRHVRSLGLDPPERVVPVEEQAIRDYALKTTLRRCALALSTRW